MQALSAISRMIAASRSTPGPAASRSANTSYVRDFLAFLGITDIEFVYAEGLAISEASKTASLAKARESIHGMVPALA